ncbi:lactate dehydrogenase [Novosphingobium malaysiense]|uniref:Lactate dehydrogenase n=1 Tax=Novosphingobium malaysiense TaxID=1348853 RepID=A0A0B1ZNM2_9SPHN|nr:lactate dehydrogenase [Novosphingobium malaysiense]
MGGTPRRPYYAGPNLDRVESIADLRARAHRLMPRFVLEYLEGGAGEEQALAREREAYADWFFVPRFLRDVSHRSASGQLLGKDARMPLAIAPTGLNGVFMLGADSALARAAARFGVPFVQGTLSNESMEDIARIPGLRHWWQLYVFGGEEIWTELVDRAERAGCEALVLTVNAQQFGMREWDSRQRGWMGLPHPISMLNSALHPRWAATTMVKGMPSFPNVIDFIPKDKRSFFESASWIRSQMPKSLTWENVARIRGRWKRPFFVKGLLHPDDIRAARDSGVDGVILGTHGGRQTDWSVSALDVLPEARDILGSDKALYMSGGIRRGSDIIKAMALGADAVLTGRATLYGLCAYGEKGARKALELLEHEVRNDLAQIGIDKLTDLDMSYLRPAAHLATANGQAPG